MGALFAVARKDLLRRIRSPLAVAVFLAFPIVFSLLIGLAFGGGGGSMAPIRVAFVDDDGGFGARLLRAAFDQTPLPQGFEVLAVDASAGLTLLEDDDAAALVRVPAGFTDSLLAGARTWIEVVKNPAGQVYPRIVEQIVATLAQVGGSAVEVLGSAFAPAVAIGRERPPTEAEVLSIAASVHRTVNGVGRYVLPPAVRIAPLEEPRESESGPSVLEVAAFVLPGMAVFALLMFAMVMTADFQHERRRGSLARQFTAPVPFLAVVAGKIAAVWIVSLACIAVLAAVAVLWAAPEVSIPGFLMLSAAFALCAVGFGALLQSVSRSERAGSAIGSVLVLVMAALGGSWVPMEMLPAFVQRIAPFTLTWWGNEGYRALLFRSAGVVEILPNLAVLVGMGALMTAASLPLFRRWFRGGA